jgi:hypothetical protein
MLATYAHYLPAGWPSRSLSLACQLLLRRRALAPREQQQDIYLSAKFGTNYLFLNFGGNNVFEK